MAYPPEITTRAITVGGASGLESGDPLSITVTIRTVLPGGAGDALVWEATGWQYPPTGVTATGDAGTEVTVHLPVTDLPGWRSRKLGALIDVSAPGSYSHRYIATIDVLQNGRPIDRHVTPPFVLPAGDLSVVDLDKMVEASTVAGGTVSIPDTWSARLDALEAGGVDPAVIDAAVEDYLAENPPAAVPAASETVSGTVELATTAEATAGTDTVRAVTPAGLKAHTDALPTGGVSSWDDLTDKPATFPPTAHTHTLADVTDYAAPDLSGYATDTELADGLATKANTAHTHGAADLSGVVKTVNNTAPDVAGNVTVTVGEGGTSDHGALTGLADDDHVQYHTDARGDARYSQLGHTHVVADLTDYSPGSGALDTEAVQDVVGAMITGAGGSYDDGAGTITLPAGGGTGAVDSVNGKTGAVVLDAADVGADPAGTAAALVAGVSQPAGGLPRSLGIVPMGLANADVAPFKLLFLGDSLTWSGSAWVDHAVKRLAQRAGLTPIPTALKSKVSTDVAVPATGIYAVNCAADGASASNYIVNDNAVAMATALQPHIVIHGVGTNDFLGSMHPTNSYEVNIRNAIASVDGACTIAPVHLFWWFGSMYNDAKPYPADDYINRLLVIAADFPGRVAVVDLGPYADTLSVHNLDPYDLDGGDKIHLSAAGSRTVGELMASALLAPPTVGILGYSAPAPVTADTTAPAWTATLTTGTPTQTSVDVTASALATDAVGVTGYDYSLDSGTTWAAITPAGMVFTLSGLTASTGYPAPQFRAKDAAGNLSTPVLSAQSFTTAAPVADTTAPTPGTLAGSSITDTTFTLTVTGATDAGSGLHATPYAFSTDNGATWSAWQASAVLNVTGKTAETAYQCQHKVRDAASTPNEATGTPITVTTTATPVGPTTITDSFNRADSTTGLGVTDTGQTWTEIGAGVMGISNQTAYRVSGSPLSVVDFGSSDMDVSYKAATAAAYHYLIARCVDANNYYYLDFGSTGKTPKLRWKKAGADSGAGGTFSIVDGDIVTLRTKTRGAGGVTITLLINGVEQITYDDTTSTINGTKAGIGGAGASAFRLDDFTVTAAP